jgi:hypothetical protein
VGRTGDQGRLKIVFDGEGRGDERDEMFRRAADIKENLESGKEIDVDDLIARVGADCA